MDEDLPPEVEELMKKAIEEALVAAFRKAFDEAFTCIVSEIPHVGVAPRTGPEIIVGTVETRDRIVVGTVETRTTAAEFE